MLSVCVCLCVCRSLRRYGAWTLSVYNIGPVGQNIMHCLSSSPPLGLKKTAPLTRYKSTCVSEWAESSRVCLFCIPSLAMKKFNFDLNMKAYRMKKVQTRYNRGEHNGCNMYSDLKGLTHTVIFRKNIDDMFTWDSSCNNAQEKKGPHSQTCHNHTHHHFNFWLLAVHVIWWRNLEKRWWCEVKCCMHL